MVQIRKCQSSDASAIQKLNLEVMKYDYAVEKTEEKLNLLLQKSEHCLFVAEYKGEIAGYIHLCDYDAVYFGHMKNVLCLAVFPQFRRKGVASRLLAMGELWARETGACGIRLDSGIERVPAHGCYEKAGYENLKMHKYFRKMFETK